MIRNLGLVSITVISTLFLSANFAGAQDQNKSGKGNPACQRVRVACESAGYQKGADKGSGKRRGKNCVSPLLEGKEVQGVTVAAADIKACAEHRAAKRKSKSDRRVAKALKEANSSPDASGGNAESSNSGGNAGAGGGGGGIQ